MSDHGWSLGRRSGFVIAAAAVAAGVVLLVIVLKAQVSAPEPHSAGRIHVPAHSATPGRTPHSKATQEAAPPLGPSKPLRLRIPSIGVDTPVNQLGLAADGTLAVPQPGPRLDEAAWFENSPTPGQPGPSIIEGHVDSVEGPSVFLELGAVKPGDKILVQRADGHLLTFEVNAVRDFLKSEFPTTLVYGPDHMSVPTLRLITCSDFNASTRHHVGNEVVFAHLIHVSRASATS